MQLPVPRVPCTPQHACTATPVAVFLRRGTTSGDTSLLTGTSVCAAASAVQVGSVCVAHAILFLGVWVAVMLVVVAVYVPATVAFMLGVGGDQKEQLGGRPCLGGAKCLYPFEAERGTLHSLLTQPLIQKWCPPPWLRQCAVLLPLSSVLRYSKEGELPLHTPQRAQSCSTSVHDRRPGS